MTSSKQGDDASGTWPAPLGLRARLVCGVAGAERLADVRARLDEQDGDWEAEIAIAADWGLLVIAGGG